MLRNSLWISIQPIVLNLISIFVVGYIANNLGKEDYGKFVFAFALMAMMLPIGTLGLRAVTVRDMAADRENAPILFGKIFTLRIILSFFSFGLVVLIVNLMGKPESTKIIVYIAGLNIIFQNLSTSLFDSFQAYEKMKFIAFANLIAGALLTLFSIIVIYLGYRLVAVTLVYVSGGLIRAITIAILYKIHLPPFKLKIDLAMWWDSIKKGVPFFLVAVLFVWNIRISVVLLSKLAGEVTVGVYGAALTLIEKLSIFPDSIGTAIFPTIALLFARKQMQDLSELTSNFFRYLLLVGLPIALGLALLSANIIDLIFGDKYQESALVLTLLACGIPFLFMHGLFGFGLGAVHLQNKNLLANSVAIVINIAATLVLVPWLGYLGAAIAYGLSIVTIAAMQFYYFRRFLKFSVRAGDIFKILLSNIVLAAAILLLRDFNLLLAVLIPGGIYLGTAVLIGAVNREDFKLFGDALLRRKKKK